MRRNTEETNQCDVADRLRRDGAELCQSMTAGFLWSLPNQLKRSTDNNTS